MPLISGASGAVSGAGSGMVFGPVGAIAGGVIGAGLGIYSGFQNMRRREAIQGDLRKLEGLQDELISEQLSMDAFQRQRQGQVVSRNAAVAMSRMRAASIAAGTGLGSVAQQATQSIAGQQAVEMRDIQIGRESMESTLDIQRRMARRQAKMQSR